MTAVSQQGTMLSSFYLGSRLYAVNGGTEVRWGFATTGLDQASGDALWFDISMTSRPLSDGDTDVWTHLVAVYDAQLGQVRLYVNGQREAAMTRSPVFNAAGPLTVGGARFTPTGGTPVMTDRWFGGIDDLMVFQGAMTDAQVRLLHDQQALSGI
jgi:hypothetical protein